MTRIVSNHRLAHRAALAVCTVLDLAGALTETIKNDYGEDLLVQTHLRDMADHFNILVQVKGTKLRPTKDGKHSFSVDVSHAHRWASHMQPVLVCIFDQTSNQIFAFYPRRAFSLWDLSTTNKKSITVKLADNDVFDQTTALRFIWECRVEHFSRMLAWYENAIMYADHASLDMNRRKSIMSEGNIVVLNFLKSLGLLEDDEFTIKFRKSVEYVSTNFAKHNAKHPEDPLGMRALFMLCVLGYANEVTGTGIPSNLMEHATDLAGALFKSFHNDEWARAGELVGDLSWPPIKAVLKKRLSRSRKA